MDVICRNDMCSFLSFFLKVSGIRYISKDKYPQMFAIHNRRYRTLLSVEKENHIEVTEYLYGHLNNTHTHWCVIRMHRTNNIPAMPLEFISMLFLFFPNTFVIFCVRFFIKILLS